MRKINYIRKFDMKRNVLYKIIAAYFVLAMLTVIGGVFVGSLFTSGWLFLIAVVIVILDEYLRGLKAVRYTRSYWVECFNYHLLKWSLAGIFIGALIINYHLYFWWK